MNVPGTLIHLVGENFISQRMYSGTILLNHCITKSIFHIGRKNEKEQGRKVVESIDAVLKVLQGITVIDKLSSLRGETLCDVVILNGTLPKEYRGLHYIINTHSHPHKEEA